MFNPANYARSYNVNYKASRQKGQSDVTMIFTGVGDSDLSFKLIVDGTGIVPLPGGGAVDDYIANALSVMSNFNGTEHRPNYLKLIWGSLSMVCRCKTVNVSYTLFNEDGTALRATLEPKFTKTTDFKTKVQEAVKSSPDLTHVRTVQAGDTLALMTYKIYGDSWYYLEVVKVNQLKSVNSIKPGHQIFFPPISKI
jgi:LysM repeat protein